MIQMLTLSLFFYPLLHRPDFAQIDQFKDEICDALASYSSKIEHYLKEMNECDQACDALREELGRLKTVGTRVRGDARCAFTNKYVLEEREPFCAFPLGYVVLETALKREVMPYLNQKQVGRVKFIENELARVRRLRGSGGRSTHEMALYDYDIEELQVELDGLIAAECPLTGSVMVAWRRRLWRRGGGGGRFGVKVAARRRACWQWW